MTVPSNAQYASGTGVVTGDQLNTFVQTCSTAAQLRSFIGVSGMNVSLLGISAANDGYGGVFWWNASSRASDDNINTIVPNGVVVGGWNRVTAVSSVPTVTLSGDVTGSGTTAITTTLATVNTNVGTFQGLTINGKGLVIAATTNGAVSGTTGTFSGAVSGTTGAFSSATITMPAAAARLDLISVGGGGRDWALVSNVGGLFSLFDNTGATTVLNESSAVHMTLLAGLTATTGTFSGGVSGTTGAFSSAVSGTTANFSGALSATTGTFTGAFSATTGAFSGAVSGTTGTFSGAVSGTTGTFSAGVSGGSTTVAGLSAAGTAGRRSFVTDATVTTFASIVVGGGTNKVPVYDDGTNWRIG